MLCCHRVVVLLLSYCCHVVLSYCCHVVAVVLSYCCHVVAVVLSYCCHVVAVVLSYCCHVVAVVLLLLIVVDLTPLQIPGATELGITSDDLFSLKTPPGKTCVAYP